MLGRRKHAGFTMLEIMVAVGILGVLVGIGWGSMQAHLPRFRLVRMAKKFRSDLVLMRQIAVQSNRETKLEMLGHSGDCSDTTTWGGAWQMAVGDRLSGSRHWDLLPEDSFNDGSDDDQSTAIQSFFQNGNISGKDVCLHEWSTLLGPSNVSNAHDSIVFSPRGWLRNPPSDFNNHGYMEFDFYNQEAARQGVSDIVKVQISRSGMIRLLRVPAPHNLNTVGTSVSSSVQ